MGFKSLQHSSLSSILRRVCSVFLIRYFQLRKFTPASLILAPMIRGPESGSPVRAQAPASSVPVWREVGCFLGHTCEGVFAKGEASPVRSWCLGGDGRLGPSEVRH